MDHRSNFDGDIDDELNKQLDWEEELEKQYGDLEDSDSRPKKMGHGFSKQKQIIEEGGGWQDFKKSKVKIKDKTKKIH